MLVWMSVWWRWTDHSIETLTVLDGSPRMCSMFVEVAQTPKDSGKLCCLLVLAMMDAFCAQSTTLGMCERLSTFLLGVLR